MSWWWEEMKVKGQIPHAVAYILDLVLTLFTLANLERNVALPLGRHIGA